MGNMVQVGAWVYVVTYLKCGIRHLKSRLRNGLTA